VICTIVKIPQLVRFKNLMSICYHGYQLGRRMKPLIEEIHPMVTIQYIVAYLSANLARNSIGRYKFERKRQVVTRWWNGRNVGLKL
jgi:hypothetical protein